MTDEADISGSLVLDEAAGVDLRHGAARGALVAMRKLIAVGAVVMASACKQDAPDPALAARRAAAMASDIKRRDQEITDRVGKVLRDRSDGIRGGGFATRPNAIYDCVTKSGVNMDPNFNFGSRTSLAYKFEFGDELAAQYMYKYVSAASACTPFSSSDLQEAMIPALPYIASPIQLSNAIAMAGDMSVRTGHATIEKFSYALAQLTAIAAHDER